MGARKTMDGLRQPQRTRPDVQLPSEPLHRSPFGGEGEGRRIFNLDSVLAGNLDPVIDALLELDKLQRLESL